MMCCPRPFHRRSSRDRRSSPFCLAFLDRASTKVPMSPRWTTTRKSLRWCRTQIPRVIVGNSAPNPRGSRWVPAIEGQADPPVTGLLGTAEMDWMAVSSYGSGTKSPGRFGISSQARP